MIKQDYFNTLGDEGLSRILQLNAYLGSTSFYHMPASTKFHGNFRGGLLAHSAAVFDSLMKMTEQLGLEWLRPESPYIIAYGHDVCKIDAYKLKNPGWETEDEAEFKCRYCGYVTDYPYEHCPQCDAHMGTWTRNDSHPSGHADLSLKMLDEAGIKLTDEEANCIRWHMGAFDDAQNWSNYTKAIHKFPNVLWTHTADMEASHIKDI